MRLCLSVIAFLVLRMCILVVSRYDGLMVHSLCYYRENWRREVREGVAVVIQWILTEHYQKGSVSEELLNEMLFWSCRYMYVHTLVSNTNTYMYMYVLMVRTCIYTCHCFSMYPPVVRRKDVVK